MKAFLSHSSADKKLVRPVFDILSAAHAHFDEATFDPLGRSYDSIVSAIRDCDLIVVFASKHSIQSEWVKEEIGIAIDKATSGKIMRRAVVLLDGVSRTSLPTSLQAYTALKQTDPNLLARRILSLISGDAPRKMPFLGRDADNLRLKSALLPPEGAGPSAVFLAGIDGVGKRTLITRALRDCFSYLPERLRVINVPEFAGPESIYLRLVENGRSMEELLDLTDSFNELDGQEQIGQLSVVIADIARSGDVVMLYGAEELKNDDGDIMPWVSELISLLPSGRHPSLILLSRHQLAPTYRIRRPALLHMVIHSIDAEDSQRLLSQLVADEGISLSLPVMSRLAQATEGHPGQVVRASKLISADGGVSTALLTSDIVDTLTNAHEVARVLQLDEMSLTVVAIFSEFGLISPDDVHEIVDDNASVAKSIRKLVDQCIIEPVGDMLRIAPVLEYLVRRVSRGRFDEDFFSAARGKLARRLRNFSVDDVVPIDILDQSVIALLQTSDRQPAYFDRMLVAATVILPLNFGHPSKRRVLARTALG